MLSQVMKGWFVYGAVRLNVIGIEASQPKAQFPSVQYADCARGWRH
jgi:hypothetical protein